MSDAIKKQLNSLLLAVLLTMAVNARGDSSFVVRIGNLADVPFGSIVEIPVSLDAVPYDLHAFNFLISFDPSALSLLSADPGWTFFSDSGCGWEYFNFKVGPSGNCGMNAC
ncbi:MAG: cohesin domain-containing protein, partial [Candidatus Zixiibacteriota bacterium]